MSKYAKMIIALLGTIVTWAIATFPNNHNVQIFGGLGGILLTTATVYLVPNATATIYNEADAAAQAGK